MYNRILCIYLTASAIIPLAKYIKAGDNAITGCDEALEDDWSGFELFCDSICFES